MHQSDTFYTPPFGPMRYIAAPWADRHTLIWLLKAGTVLTSILTALAQLAHALQPLLAASE